MQVVPNDTHAFVESLIREIYQNCPRFPEVIYTDNVGKDRNELKAIIRRMQQERAAASDVDQDYQEVNVVQDLYHARERIATTLPKAHPDYKPALAALKELLARVVSKDHTKHYRDTDELKDAVTAWLQKYQQPQQHLERLSDKEFCRQLAIGLAESSALRAVRTTYSCVCTAVLQQIILLTINQLKPSLFRTIIPFSRAHVI